MSLGRLWAGRAFGTNTGNLFLKIDGDDSALSGTLHFKEPSISPIVYSIEGNFDGNILTITGIPQTQIEGIVFGHLSATANLTTRGELNGEWSTSIGSAGTFRLFPHDQTQAPEADTGKMTDQLHTARHYFGVVAVDRNKILDIADKVQSDFKIGQVIVTVLSDTEQSRFLTDFRTIDFGTNRATIIKLFVQEPEGGGVSRIVQVEFAPKMNMVMTQGGDEAWVLGMLEKIKRNIRPLERTYATNFKKFGFGINHLLLVGAVIFLPSLSDIWDRAILMAGVLTLILGINWLHNRYLPFAAIYLGKKPKGVIAWLAPSAISWIIAATASIAAILLAAYLQGWLSASPASQ